MKTKSKALLLALCAVLLVVASVLTTLAFLTSTDSVDNVFTVGNVKLENELGHGIDEADVDENGIPEYKEDETTLKDRVQTNTYKLQPGKTYVKDPTIHVASSSDPCFLFVKVENGIANIEAATDTAEGGYQNIAAQMAAHGWIKVTDDTIVDGVYAYAITDKKDVVNLVAVEGSEDIKVFEQFKIDGTVDGTTLDLYKDAHIVVTAYAVQAEGFSPTSYVDVITAAFPALVETAD